MEQFVKIPGFEEYEISNLGYVISYKNKNPKKLTISEYPNGYKFVSLCKDGEKQKGIFFIVWCLCLFNLVKIWSNFK